MRTRSSRLAFTLLEMMIAIAMLSLIMGAIFATWQTIIRASKASQYAAAEAQRTRIALSCLEQSLTYTEMYVANARYYWFNAENGSSASLSFVSHLPDDFPRSGRFGGIPVRRVQFSIQSGREGGQELVLRQSLINREFDQDEREHPLVLMKNIKSLDMEFWDAQKQDWTDEWLQTNQLPKLISVVVTTDNPKSTHDRGESYMRIISPASVAVQPGWQSQGAGAPSSTPVPPAPPAPAIPPTRPGTR